MQLGKLETEGPRRLLEREQRFGGRSGLRFRAETGTAEGQSDSSADKDEGDCLAKDFLLHAYPVAVLHWHMLVALLLRSQCACTLLLVQQSTLWFDPQCESYPAYISSTPVWLIRFKLKFVGTGEPEDGIEEVSPGVVAAAAAARRARRAGPHAHEAALFRELEQAERGFSAGAGATHSEAASGGAQAQLLAPLQTKKTLCLPVCQNHMEVAWAAFEDR